MKQSSSAARPGVVTRSIQSHNHARIAVALQHPSLAARLRAVRRVHGWTQEQVAERANTNQAQYQKIENGKSKRPRNLDDIAAVLGVPEAALQFSSSELQNALNFLAKLQ